MYDFFKPVALVWLPAIATLYTVLAPLWHLGDVTEVVGSLSAIDTFLGAVLHLSSKSAATPTIDPSKSPIVGNMVIDTSGTTKDVYSIEVTSDPTTWAQHKTITMAVMAKSS
jgi:hypothetical protein